MRTIDVFKEQVDALRKDYKEKDTQLLLMMATIAMETYTGKTSSDESLARLAGLVAMVILSESRLNSVADCDVQKTLKRFCEVVQEIISSLDGNSLFETTIH